MSARQEFRAAIESGEPVFAPLCLTPLTARIVEEQGYRAGYLSGGALGYELAVSEALLTLTELATASRQITRRSGLPLIVDGGVGFGDAVHGARTIWELEETGAAAIELEDQVAPKRVSHHRGVEHLIPKDEMAAKIRVAADARVDPDFLIIARTGGVRNESFDSAIERAKAYRDAGADILMLFPSNEDGWEAAPKLLDAPLAAITSLDARTPTQWAELGWSLVIDPFTAQLLSVEVVRNAYARFAAQGNTGTELGGERLRKAYAELSDLAGLEELFQIERETTERDREERP